jgi:hypothetical protein
VKPDEFRNRTRAKTKVAKRPLPEQSFQAAFDQALFLPLVTDQFPLRAMPIDAVPLKVMPLCTVSASASGFLSATIQADSAKKTPVAIMCFMSFS